VERGAQATGIAGKGRRVRKPSQETCLNVCRWVMEKLMAWNRLWAFLY